MLIEMKNITKTYGPTVANKNVSIDLRENEILAIIGENGAGKSTIMKILYGLVSMDSGEIFVKGKKVDIDNPIKAMDLGIGMVQQHFMFFDTLSVAENIVYNKEIKKGIFFDYGETNKIVRELSKDYGLDIDPKAIINDLPIGLQQKVEILKILYQQSDIIIFDEPSAVLTPIEVEELLKTIKNLKAMGKSIVIITHKLEEVMSVSDRVVVMRDGEVVYTEKTSETSEEILTYNMVLKEISKPKIEKIKPGKNILEINNLNYFLPSGKKALSNINIEVNEGEIVGIAGASGNGQSELVKVISGLSKGFEGSIKINNEEIKDYPVYKVREAGMAHVPEDRYLWGSAYDATLVDNALMSSQSKPDFSSKGILKTKKIINYTDKLIEKFNVKADNSKQKIRELSGGNAQKLIVAREFSLDANLLVVSEPTRGVDIGAMEFIHQQLLDKRKENKGILMVSSDLNEVMSLSDRIYVLFEGKVNQHFVRDSVDAKTLGMYMVKEGDKI